MIQRIQTLYVFLSMLLIGLLLAFPFAEIAEGGKLFVFDKLGISGENGLIQNGWPIAVLIIIIVLLHLIVIFGYKKTNSPNTHAGFFHFAYGRIVWHVLLFHLVFV